MIRAAVEDRRYMAREAAPSRPLMVPSPTGGLNTRDAYGDMPTADAVTLDNVYPEGTFCRVRRGSAQYASGMTGVVQTLMTWKGPAGSDTLLAANNNAIYNATATGPVGAAVASGFTSNRWQWTNLSNAGNYWLSAVNGVDPPQKYNGTAWTAAAITGVSSGGGINTFAQVCAFKQRLYFAQSGTLDLYYLATGAVEGPASLFPVSAVFRRGGQIVGLGDVSNDSGQGPTNYLCIVTSNGEIAVYQGLDPTSSTTWGLVGLYDTGKPIGRRSISTLNGDMTIITQDGVISMQATFRFDRASDQRATITAKIQTLFTDYYKSYGANFGWQSIVYPRSHAFIVNVPTVDSTNALQLVMNTNTGAWCRFIGLDAVCWGTANDSLYFGRSDGTVWQADAISYWDGANAINWELATAWNAHNNAQNKLYTAARPLMLSQGGISYAMGVDTDFLQNMPQGIILNPVALSPTWPMTWPWTWGGFNLVHEDWWSVGALGVFASVHIKGVAQGGGCQMNAFELVSQSGGVY